MTADWAEINYTFLEYRLQRISSMLPYFAQEQVDYIERLQTDGPLLAQLKRAMDSQYPRLGLFLRPTYRTAKRVFHLSRSSRKAR
jgi:rhamnosyltransferase